MSLDTRIHRVVTEAVEERIFPGAVVLVAQAGMLRHAAAYGTTMYADAGSLPVTVDTCYDIASLTKMFTATAALRLVDEGVLEFDRLASDYLPGLHARGVTLRHLLTHTSGLSLRLSTLREHAPADLRAAIYALDPAIPPGTHVAYVNINTLLLGDIVAHVAGAPLDEALHRLVLAPLGMHETCFCPAEELHPHIPPTEWDTTWRGRLVQGQVHDESAWALGGVAGHAGLFSTASDVWRFMQMWLDGGVVTTDNGAVRVLRPQTVEMATRVQTEGLSLPSGGLAFHCGLGWMMRHPIIMVRTPQGTYGHTGFTGPTMVVVPACRLCVAILSNRTYPHRTLPTYHQVTAAVVEAALAEHGS
jgi:CubicO group peptidase (beta-lactamase class C family)